MRLASKLSLQKLGHVHYLYGHFLASSAWPGITAKVAAFVHSIGPLVSILHGLSLQMLIYMPYQF